MENNQPEKQDILLIETLPVLSTPANIKNRHGIDIQQFRSAENNEQDAAVIEKAYSSQSNGSAFGHTEQSYNDIRDNYTEHALNDCNNTPQSGTQRQKEPEPNPGEKAAYDYQKNIPPPQGSREPYGDIPWNNRDRPLYNKARAESATDGKYGSRLQNIDRKLEKNDKKIAALEEKKDRKLVYKYKKLAYEMDDPRDPKRLFSKETTRKLKEKKNGSIIDKSITKRQLPGRLKFKTVEKARILSEAQHNKERLKETRRSYLKRIERRRAFSGAANYFDYEDIADDADVANTKSAARKTYRGAALYTRHNLKKIRNAADPYKRLAIAKQRKIVLKNQRKKLQFYAGKDYITKIARGHAMEGSIPEGSKYYGKIKSRETAQEKRQRLSFMQHQRLKREMLRAYRKEQGNFLVRAKNQVFTKRASRKYRKMIRKRNFSVVTAFTGLALTAGLAAFLAILLGIMVSNIFTESMANTVSQNDYYDMTEAAQYFRKKEADLEESLLPENLEPVLLESHPGIYEFVYNIAEIHFDANTLVAYLSAKYIEFTLEDIKAELNAIFDEYYTLSITIKEEERDVPDETAEPDPITGERPTIRKPVPICYITLEKKDFGILLAERLEEEEQKQQMQIYYLSGNGQQVYGPVMEEDWRHKISSNYGWRVHPISKEKKFHDGVDIAVPTGTGIYSPVSGTVTRSYYSDSGGNMITIQTETGWNITFMHMDSRSVSAGQHIEQGQYMGASGNTGNSTGPHLHLQVHDSEDQPINPIFIIPFSTAEYSETYQ